MAVSLYNVKSMHCSMLSSFAMEFAVSELYEYIYSTMSYGMW